MVLQQSSNCSSAQWGVKESVGHSGRQHSREVVSLSQKHCDSVHLVHLVHVPGASGGLLGGGRLGHAEEFDKGCFAVVKRLAAAGSASLGLQELAACASSLAKVLCGRW